ncbi:MAG: DNA polymerase III subunit gamma/tau [Gemmatimonadota bacterium]|nr:DNA polymerase III subunit gamma/tau [Gemmatimonadota bacterium]
MSYLALARKYRPRRFGEVSTQEHVSQTLRHAVAGDRVGHAYLFSGPRGVGKTTLARVLAMSLNCPDRAAEGEPCGVCRDCSHIWAGHTSLDVVEIDAASNRGVDDARELRERAMYAPSEADRYKVYILDEAHMLTREAWNALLKILEEPPPRVIFVFATTEPRKIRQSASPILSRCQRFDFRRIGATDIMKRLDEVLEAEGIKADPEALRAIARKANGGMRDGLSLLDQVLALSDERVSMDSVVRVLGVVDEQRYLDLLDIVIERRHGAVFEFVEELIDEGHDLVEFYYGLAEKLRLLLRMSLDSSSAAGDLNEDLRDDFAGRAAAFAPGDLVRMLAMASALEADGSLRRTGRPRVLIEMLLLRMSYLDRTVELEEIIQALGGTPPGEPVSPTEPVPVVRAPLQAAGSDAPGPASAADGPGRSETPSAGTLDAVWNAVLRDRERVGRALSFLLRGSATLDGTDSGLSLVVAAGPASDELRDAPRRRALLEALALHSGRESAEISIEIDGSDLSGGEGASDGKAGPPGSPAGRVTRDSVRESRLNELVKRAPQLERAVVELDLELVD